MHDSPLSHSQSTINGIYLRYATYHTVKSLKYSCKTFLCGVNLREVCLAGGVARPFSLGRDRMPHRPRLRRRPSAGAYKTMTHAARQRAEQTYRRRCRLRDIRDFFPAAPVAPAPEAQSEDDASRDWHFDLNETDEECASDDEADEAESPGTVSTVSSDDIPLLIPGSHRQAVLEVAAGLGLDPEEVEAKRRRLALALARIEKRRRD
jgi:hypothetical protein